MNLLLLAPLGLVALAALVVPLVIHIRRRTEEVPLDFAALRWLDARPRPRSRLRFDEWLLLALRLLIVACLALLLARPAVLGWEGDGPRVLAAPGVDAAAARKAAGPETDLRWIVPGFPAVGEAPAPDRADAAFSSLVRQYDAELPPGTALTILVPPVLEKVDAEPLRLTRKVTWQVIAGADDAGQPAVVPAPALAVRYAEGQGGALRFFRAASAAWSDAPVFEASATTGLPSRDEVLVWLRPGRVPVSVTDWVNDGGTALLGAAAEIAMPATSAALWRDETGGALVEGGTLGAGRLMRFTRPLEPASMPELLSGGFPAVLRDLVMPPAPPPARVDAAAFAPSAGREPFPLPPHEFAAWLGVAIAALFLFERVIATRRRRFAA